MLPIVITAALRIPMLSGRATEGAAFLSRFLMSMNYCCHEASHVCDAIEEYTDLEHGGEPSAYLMGWIASCINNARLGIGDFVEIVDKEEK